MTVYITNLSFAKLRVPFYYVMAVIWIFVLTSSRPPRPGLHRIHSIRVYKSQPNVTSFFGVSVRWKRYVSSSSVGDHLLMTSRRKQCMKRSLSPYRLYIRHRTSSTNLSPALINYSALVDNRPPRKCQGGYTVVRYAGPAIAKGPTVSISMEKNRNCGSLLFKP